MQLFQTVIKRIITTFKASLFFRGNAILMGYILTSIQITKGS